MIVVRVELHSGVGQVTTLNTVVIDRTALYADGLRADYRVRAWKKGHDLLDVKFGRKPIREELVEDHPRQSKPVLNLVHKALTALGYAK